MVDFFCAFCYVAQSFFIINLSYYILCIMNILAYLKAFFLRNLNLKYLDLRYEPSELSPLSVWQKWIEQADWQKVYKCWKDVGYLVDDSGKALYGGTVRNLLEQRLAQIQRPVLCDAFFAKHYNVLVVQSGCSREDILRSVALQMTPKMRPQFVVDDTHKFVGFALSPQLIVAGVSAIEVFPFRAEKILSFYHLSFLSQKDALLVTRRKDLLNEMMKEAGVPDISFLKGFPLGAVGDDYVTDVWNFVPDKSGKHLRCDKSREMRFLAKI